MAQGTDGLILAIGITVWIQELFFLIIALISNTGGSGPWQRFAISECSCSNSVESVISILQA